MAKDQKKKEKKETKNSFIKEVNSELKKVTWPTGKQLVTSTGTVLIITIMLALIVFVLDFAFEKANTYGVEKLKAVVSTSNDENTSVQDSNDSAENTETTDNSTDVDGETANTTTENTSSDEDTNTSTETQTENTQTEEVAQ